MESNEAVEIEVEGAEEEEMMEGEVAIKVQGTTLLLLQNRAVSKNVRREGRVQKTDRQHGQGRQQKRERSSSRTGAKNRSKL